MKLRIVLTYFLCIYFAECCFSQKWVGSSGSDVIINPQPGSILASPVSHPPANNYYGNVSIDWNISPEYDGPGGCDSLIYDQNLEIHSEYQMVPAGMIWKITAMYHTVIYQNTDSQTTFCSSPEFKVDYIGGVLVFFLKEKKGLMRETTIPYRCEAIYHPEEGHRECTRNGGRDFVKHPMYLYEGNYIRTPCETWTLEVTQYQRIDKCILYQKQEEARRNQLASGQNSANNASGQNNNSQMGVAVTGSNSASQFWSETTKSNYNSQQSGFSSGNMTNSNANNNKSSSFGNGNSNSSNPNRNNVNRESTNPSSTSLSTNIYHAMPSEQSQKLTTKIGNDIKEMKKSIGNRDNVSLQVAEQSNTLAQNATTQFQQTYYNVASSAAELGAGIENLVRQKQEREEAERRERLAEEKEKRREAEVVSARQDILDTTFKSWPNSMTVGNTIYIFFIAWSENEYDNFELQVSDIIPIERLSDGSWPLVDKVLKKYNQGIEIKNFKMVGAFHDVNLALENISNLIANLKQKEVTYFEKLNLKASDFKPSSSRSNTSLNTNTDFWNK